MKRFIKYMAIVIFLILNALPNLFSEDKVQTSIAVLDLELGAGVPEEFQTPLSEKLRTTFYEVEDKDGTKIFKVMDRKHMREILSEQKWSLTGAMSETDIVVEIGKLLQARKIVFGSIGKLGNTYTISLQITDVERGQIENKVSEQFSVYNPAQLFKRIELMGKKLIGIKVLAINPTDKIFTLPYAVFNTYGGNTASIAISPDGKLLASGGSDGVIKIWDIKDKTMLKTLNGHSGSINAIEFSPEGSLLASGASDNKIGLWDVQSAQIVKFLTGHSKVLSLAFHPEDFILSSGEDIGDIALWDINTGKLLGRLKKHRGKILSLAFDDRGQLISGGEDGTIVLWNVATQRDVRVLNVTKTLDRVSEIAFSPDLVKLALAGNKGEFMHGYKGFKEIRFIKVFDGTTGVEIGTFEDAHIKDISSLAFDPQGRFIISGGLDHETKIWDTEENRQISTHRLERDKVTCVAYSPDGRWVAAGTEKGKVMVWQVQ